MYTFPYVRTCSDLSRKEDLMRRMCSEFTIMITNQRLGRRTYVFIVNFEHTQNNIQRIILVF